MRKILSALVMMVVFLLMGLATWLDEEIAAEIMANALVDSGPNVSKL